MKEKEKPLVTVILTAYNQEKYVGETLKSVFDQTYTNLELIVIDNASTDDSILVIEAFKNASRNFLFIKNRRNSGLCAAFNHGLSIARGKYVIDLSGDDLLMPDRIEKQVEAFELLAEDFAVVFSNAKYISPAGKELDDHYTVDPNGSAIRPVPSGDVYKNVLERYFICTPTMMMRTSTMLELGGYDETLTFEDFDFWVRSAAKYKYFYLDEILTRKRIVPTSLSSMVYKKGSGMLASYYAVCNKAYDLNRDQKEFDLLAARIRTFIRKCWYAQEYELAVRFRVLLNYIENPGWQTELIVFMCRLHLPVNFAYRFYIKNLKKALSQEGFSF
ncbi:glycosyltransferase [Dyadobacter psychrophilus]|uniref:Glycosyltransferase involved in cell wall bisynthesis n=1 Tax=Dyadobacter psychrophilus TaxID=651661 RepID=A0A1T5C5D7_9BACT|nr:glycosyltransferase [Dyadobacter psychrophilus]SKB54605.1 Glycosyltransferase involved in cell wall bisynthesis [Dyadobacter psychrophilus]